MDASLIAQLVQKDARAYNTFYEQTVDMLYRFVVSRYAVRSQDVEDMLSDFYIKFWKVVERYDDTYAFETYMWTVFRNCIKDYFKKHGKHTFVDEQIVAEVQPSDDKSALDMTQLGFEFDQIRAAMQELDELSYQIIFLKYIEQATYEEIASIVGMSQSAVRKRVSRALEHIRSVVGE